MVEALQRRRVRSSEGLFVAEGPKTVGELLSAFELQRLICTADYPTPAGFGGEVNRVTPEELRRISLLEHPQQVIAVFRLPDWQASLRREAEAGLVLALDQVQDPGNMGTIIRTASWFGVRHIFCNHGTVDAFNPKVVQATMGALASVQVHYVDLPSELASYGGPLYGTFLDGSNIYKEELAECGVVVMGNEGKGISDEVAVHVGQRLHIPSFSPTPVESLNVGIATAIALSEFKRRGANAPL